MPTPRRRSTSMRSRPACPKRSKRATRLHRSAVCARRRSCAMFRGPVPQIVVANLAKAFQVAERKPGLIGALRGVARRTYRTVHALDGVSFSVEAGELIGYIG